MTGGVLEGVRVVELGQVLSGPFAGAIFADLGAEVIKIEDPAAGSDGGRYVPPFQEGESSLFVRTSPGRYTLRALATQLQPQSQGMQAAAAQPAVASQPMSALATRKPAAPAPSTARPAVTGRADSAEGGGYAS